MAALPMVLEAKTNWRDASARGWRLLPLQPRGKTPLIKGWPDVATDDEKKLAAWARQWPDCNWGALTGQASSLLVIDVDGPDGDMALVSHKAEGRVLPETLTVMTGRGWHHYFNWPHGANIRNSAGALGTGLDVRGEGGYIVIPPSIHPSGSPYEYIDPGTPIADAPEWLVSLLSESIQKMTTASKPEGVVREGRRNSTLTSLAGTMRSKGMEPKAIEAALLTQNQSYAPPLPEAEVRSIAASISRYAPAKARRPDTVCLADVVPEAVDWLWEPYIPRKMLTLLSGDPGVGKTALAMALGARLTRGEALYSGTDCKPGNLLYLTTENSASHVLRPRFDALGGDCNRFFLLRGTILEDEQSGAITLADTEALETAITEHDATLLVIDPLQSFLGAGVWPDRCFVPVGLLV